MQTSTNATLQARPPCHIDMICNAASPPPQTIRGNGCVRDATPGSLFIPMAFLCTLYRHSRLCISYIAFSMDTPSVHISRSIGGRIWCAASSVSLSTDVPVVVPSRGSRLKSSTHSERLRLRPYAGVALSPPRRVSGLSAAGFCVRLSHVGPCFVAFSLFLSEVRFPRRLAFSPSRLLAFSPSRLLTVCLRGLEWTRFSGCRGTIIRKREERQK